MDLTTIHHRLKPSTRSDGAHFVLPESILEVAPGFVVGARLDRSRGAVRRLSVRPLGTGTIEPSVARQNVSNPGELESAVASVVEAVGSGGDSLGVLVPDAAVRVAILTFESLPDSPSEVAGMAAWKMKELLPFSADEARLSYQILAKSAKHIEMLAVAGRKSVLAEYEAPLEPLNSSMVLLLPGTIALLSLLPETAEAQLLLHVSGGGLTTVLIEGDGIKLWRHQRLRGSTAEESVQEIHAEAARVLACARDRLMLEIRRAWICARPPLAPEVIAELAHKLGHEIEPLGLSAHAAANLPPKDQELFEQFGAPIAGALEHAK